MSSLSDADQLLLKNNPDLSSSDIQKYNIKKEEYQKIIDFKELSVASIEDYMDDPKNTFDLKFIYTHSTPFVRILLKRYMDNKN